MNANCFPHKTEETLSPETIELLEWLGIHPAQKLPRDEMAVTSTKAGYPQTKQNLAKVAATRDDGPEYFIFCGRAIYHVGSYFEWARAKAGKPRRASFETVAA
jgi:hypothetical protein